MGRTLFHALAYDPWAEVPPHIADALKQLEEHYGRVLKANEEQRIVVGWASVTHLGDGTPVTDTQGDVIDLDSLAIAVKQFARTDAPLYHRHGKHGKTRIGSIIEHFCLTKERKAALGLHPATCLGYLIAAKVDDREEWENAKAGALPMFSIGALVSRQSGGTLFAALQG